MYKVVSTQLNEYGEELEHHVVKVCESESQASALAKAMRAAVRSPLVTYNVVMPNGRLMSYMD